MNAVTPSLATVWKQQFRVLLRNKFVVGMYLIPTMFFFLTNKTWSVVVSGRSVELPIPWLYPPSMVQAYYAFFLVAAAAAAMVWLGEGPDRRRFHWSMPVKRETHDLIRILVGAAWLLFVIADFVLFYYLREPAVMREQWLSHAPTFFVGIFAAPLLAYLLCCVIAQMVERPWLWIFLSIVLMGIAQSQSLERAAPQVGKLGKALFSSERSLSLGSALNGGEQGAPWHVTSERMRVFKETRVETFARAQAEGLNVGSIDNLSIGGFGSYGPARPLSVWLKPLLLWYAIAIAALMAALRHRPNV